MKHVFLVNKFSLKNKTDQVRAIVEEVCKKRNIDYIIEQNSEEESTEDILKRYQDTKDIIIAIGGDGTINRVLNGIAGTQNVLGYIPYGTGNDFYRVNKELLTEEINKIDLVRINEKYFINTACFGIDADIANSDEIVHSKLIPKKQRYNISLIYHLLKYKAKQMTVDVHSDITKGEFTTVIVCNGRYYGGGYKVAPHSTLDDGLVDVYLVNKTSKPNMAKVIMSIKSGAHEKAKIVKKLQTDKLTIVSPTPISSNIDGEKLTANEFNIEVIPKGIDVYYNQPLIDDILEEDKKLSLRRKK